jgi:hypothetical protein
MHREANLRDRALGGEVRLQNSPRRSAPSAFFWSLPAVANVNGAKGLADTLGFRADSKPPLDMPRKRDAKEARRNLTSVSRGSALVAGVSPTRGVERQFHEYRLVRPLRAGLPRA